MSEIYKNYFSPKSVAEKYARGRPHFHPFIIDQIKKFLKIDVPLSFALDVGCGTGLSTIALKEIAHCVTALDISSEMLAFAPRDENLNYLLASAESLPFGEDKFDLITISQAIHWLDKDKFFEECGRVLKPNGWVVAFDNYYTGQMVDNESFSIWNKEKYLQTFPKTLKHQISFKTESENPNAFILWQEEWHKNIIEFSALELVNYLITQSNVIALVEGGIWTIENVTKWLTAEISPLFVSEAKKSFIFTAPIWYLRRQKFSI